MFVLAMFHVKQLSNYIAHYLNSSPINPPLIQTKQKRGPVDAPKDVKFYCQHATKRLLIT